MKLFAAEPDILKPINMAFDNRGRLWVTNTIEYPIPAPPNRKGRDSVRILEDTDGDGKADKITTFADGLNIPLGVYPYKDGAVVFSIPYIWFLRDTNGDGKADRRIKLYGPMGYKRDAHGLNNSFRRGFDGWLYACHGFNNVTTVKGTDGHTVHMQSGNTYRFRLDGTHIEQFTHGQVNPFGMSFDPLGNLYSADCHSKPLTLLLRGGYYTSFGKPHDGLGFAPAMLDHQHGSTAISGLAYYDAAMFPAQYRNNIFTGNVMTSRINRDSLVIDGSTVLAKDEPDFVVTTDPWFRPVDLQLAPDGSLYVADFYNRIIGHYEVPLTHPGRDRRRGRIWKIVYKGDASQSEKTPVKPESKPAAQRFDLTRLPASGLIAALDVDNQTTRLLALNRLVDTAGVQTVTIVRAAFQKSASGRLRSHAIWVLHRLHGLDLKLLTAAAQDSDRRVRVHAMRVLSETPRWSQPERNLAVAALGDSDGFVQRAAADAIGQHPKYENIRPLLDLLNKVPGQDLYLRYTLRMALRDQFRQGDNLARFSMLPSSKADSQTVASICLAVKSPAAGSFLLRHVRQHPESRQRLADYLRHAARYVPHGQTDALVRFVRSRFGNDVDFQLGLLLSIQSGLERRGTPLSRTINQWGTQLAGQLLDSIDADSASWGNSPLAGKTNTDNPWGLRTLRASDGDERSTYLYSKARGEQLTGILRSRSFIIPPKLRFYLAGHVGYPNKPVVHRNFVRLRDVVTHRVLAEAVPPRNDVAQAVTWNLGRFAGRKGYLEIVDGDDGPGYAWLAVGRIEPPVVRIPRLDPALVTHRRKSAAQIAARLRLSKLAPRLATLLLNESTETSARSAAARALVAIKPDSRIAALVPVISDPSISADSRDEISRVIVRRDPVILHKALAQSIRTAPQRLQIVLAETLAGDKTGAETLLKLVADGHASPRLLQNQTVRGRLLAVKPRNIAKRIAALTQHLPPLNEQVRKQVGVRIKAYRRARASAVLGSQVFTKTCAVCHQIGEKGKLVGPQLDGIGNRGLERIVEDILDPNRNVDVAFRSTTLLLESGKVRTGLLRRAEGAVLILVDSKGQEFTVAADDVAERKKSPVSLMPEGLVKTLSNDDFNHLLAFLLSQRGKQKQMAKGTKPAPSGNSER